MIPAYVDSSTESKKKKADKAYKTEICEDIQEECEKYGSVIEMKIPRPSGGSRQSNGVGKIFIKYEDSNGARKALQALAGRKFQDRTVVTTYFSEVRLFFLSVPLLSILHFNFPPSFYPFCARDRWGWDGKCRR